MCDDVMKHVCDILKIEIPEFNLRRRIHIKCLPDEQHFEIFGSSMG